jgi:hypothetical protein
VEKKNHSSSSLALKCATLALQEESGEMSAGASSKCLELQGSDSEVGECISATHRLPGNLSTALTE